MAGQPRKRLMIAELEKRAAQYFGDGTSTVLDYVEHWVEDGRTVTKLAEEISMSIGMDLGPAPVLRYLRTAFGEAEVKRRLDSSRRNAAPVLAEQTIDITDAATGRDKDEAAKVRNQVSSRQWLAERWGREEFGVQRGTQVTINVASMHLDALRRREVSDGERTSRARLTGVEEAADAIAGAIDVEYIESTPDEPTS